MKSSLAEKKKKTHTKKPDHTTDADGKADHEQTKGIAQGKGQQPVEENAQGILPIWINT